VKCIEFSSRDCGSLHCALTLTDRPYSYEPARSRFEIFCRSNWNTMQLLLYSRLHALPARKYLVRPDINKTNWKETIFLTCLVSLLRNNNVKYYEVQKGEDSTK